jgi:hypothetical protein
MSARTSQTYIQGQAIIKPNAVFLGKPCVSKEERKEKLENLIQRVERKIDELLKEFKWEEVITGGKEKRKAIRVFCPDCKIWIDFRVIIQLLRHREKKHGIKMEFDKLEFGKINQMSTIKGIDRDLFNTTKKLTENEKKRRKQEIKKEAKKFEPDRTFYIDAALTSLKAQNGNRYWKSSIVENGRMLKSFCNSKIGITGAVSAEAYTVLKVICHLEEEGWTGKVLIWCDNMNVVNFMNGCRPKKFKISSKYHQYLLCVLRKLEEYGNKIELKVKWVKGEENPADFYSRNKPKQCQKCKTKRYLAQGAKICYECRIKDYQIIQDISQKRMPNLSA